MAEEKAEQEYQKQMQQFAAQNYQEELDQEMKRADALAKLVADFKLNDKGEELANVQNSQGFQAVWDPKGSELARFRLDRKREQVAARYNASSQLFQKVYYAKDLVLKDEQQLRAAFFSA